MCWLHVRRSRANSDGAFVAEEERRDGVDTELPTTLSIVVGVEYGKEGLSLFIYLYTLYDAGGGREMCGK